MKYIINKTKFDNGGHYPIQSWNGATPPDGYAFVDESWFSVFYPTDKKAAGFVNVTYSDDGLNVVNMVWDDESYEAYAQTLPDTLEYVKEQKIAEMSEACSNAINAGTEVQFDDRTEHFDVTLEDQANLTSITNAVLLGATEYPYHYKDGSCKIYSAKDIMTIYVNLNLFLTHHQTYFNQLKQYIKTLDNEDDVNAVTYGQELTGEYLNNYNEMMASANTQIQKVLENITTQNLAQE